MIAVPSAALQFGFVNEPVGSHTSRTIMVPELTMVLDACPTDATLAMYQSAAIEDNVLEKGTLSTRQRSFRQLRELYALDPTVLIFRAMRDLWGRDQDAHPQIALLCAAARDVILRVAVTDVLDTQLGTAIDNTRLGNSIEHTFPGRYKLSVRSVTVRNVLGSLRQAGYIAKAPSRERLRATSTPASTAYALLLGHLCGARGDLLFETQWVRMLDQPAHILREHAATASRRGWLEYRSAGGVTEISFRLLLRGWDIAP